MSEDKGRPTKYREEYNDIAKRLAIGGYSDKNIAEILGVAEQNFHLWKKRYPDFRESLNEGRAMVVANIAKSMYQRAVGYKTEEVREKVDPVTGEVIERVVTKKKIPAETGAASLMLKAKAPDIYNRKQEVDITSSDGSMTPRTLDSFYEKSE